MAKGKLNKDKEQPEMAKAGGVYLDVNSPQLKRRVYCSLAKANIYVRKGWGKIVNA